MGKGTFKLFITGQRKALTISMTSCSDLVSNVLKYRTEQNRFTLRCLTHLNDYILCSVWICRLYILDYMFCRLWILRVKKKSAEPVVGEPKSGLLLCEPWLGPWLFSYLINYSTLLTPKITFNPHSFRHSVEQAWLAFRDLVVWWKS